MTKLNIILITLIMLQVGTVFAKNNSYYLSQELIQHEAILDIQDLLCIDDCEQDTMIAQVISINQALGYYNGK